MSVLGSESKIQIDSNVLLENGRVITNPILGLFFLDYGTLDVAPIFLLDERSTRVNAMDLIADASDATGRDFSSANLQEVIFAHHRQEWIEHDRPTLDELREHVQASLHALFGSSDQQSIAEKNEVVGEECSSREAS
jgi:hypothetical protein